MEDEEMEFLNGICKKEVNIFWKAFGLFLYLPINIFIFH